MKLSELLKGTCVTPADNRERMISSLEDDSRRVKPGSLFIAVRGFETDGHNFIQQAFERGAAAVIAEHPVACSQDLLINPTGDNRSILAELAARFYHRPWEDMLTVGITGTNGKTSTARMLFWIMEAHGMQSGVIGTVGHIIGGEAQSASVTTPGSLEIARLMADMRDSGDRSCVMEVSSHALSMARVDAVRFDVGLFTNISQDHLDHHGTMEEYLECKLRLFDLLKSNGTAIVGTYAKGHPYVDGALTFGTEENDDFRISDIRVWRKGTSFLLLNAGAVIPVNLKAPGRFNAYNAAGAVAAAEVLGVDPVSAAESLSGFPGVPGRFEVVDLGQDFLVAVDYAHTPDALDRVLRQGAELRSGRLISVFGAGGDRDSGKRSQMGKIASEICDLTIITSDNPRTEDPGAIIGDILSGIRQEKLTGGEVLVEPDRRQAIRAAIGMAAEGDVIVIAGKGHEDYQILGREKIHFDDREEATAALGEVMNLDAR